MAEKQKIMWRGELIECIVCRSVEELVEVMKDKKDTVFILEG